MTILPKHRPLSLAYKVILLSPVVKRSKRRSRFSSNDDAKVRKILIPRLCLTFPFWQMQIYPAFRRMLKVLCKVGLTNLLRHKGRFTTFFFTINLTRGTKKAVPAQRRLFLTCSKKAFVIWNGFFDTPIIQALKRWYHCRGTRNGSCGWGTSTASGSR